MKIIPKDSRKDALDALRAFETECYAQKVNHANFGLLEIIPIQFIEVHNKEQVYGTAILGAVVSRLDRDLVHAVSIRMQSRFGGRKPDVDIVPTIFTY